MHDVQFMSTAPQFSMPLYYLLKVNKHLLEESLKKESNTVKGAR
jgi:hypothetical protein